MADVKQNLNKQREEMILNLFPIAEERRFFLDICERIKKSPITEKVDGMSFFPPELLRKVAETVTTEAAAEATPK